MFYFIQFFLSFPPFPSLPFPCRPALLSVPFLPFSPTDLPPFFRTLCFSFSPTPPTILTPGFPLKTTTTTIPRWRRGGGGLCHPVLEHFFLFSRYFIQLFFQKWRESFYYPSARLQCLANNKSMKATFEPRGSFEKSFFANLSLSLFLFSATFLSTFLHHLSFHSTSCFQRSFLLRQGFSCPIPSPRVEISRRLLFSLFFSLSALRLSAAPLDLEFLLGRNALHKL